ncbi:hypothetical protein DFO72_11578 [Cytobacillus oceanisediminis]|uniref:Uncharacterized protein n=1 Tax=Cytobacillus oceanisediminis TaxID=665099 RepID=A0A4R8G8I7_9BACI|nr:hypothetical protein DFO72_11578 [Cytobacillus oceanisediminis]
MYVWMIYLNPNMLFRLPLLREYIYMCHPGQHMRHFFHLCFTSAQICAALTHSFMSQN